MSDKEILNMEDGIEIDDEQLSEDILGSILNNLGDVAPGMEGMEGIIAILALDGKEFEIMSAITLNEMEKSLNSPDARFNLVAGLNANGMKAEDLLSVFEELTKQLDEQISEDIMPAYKMSFLKQLLGMVVNAVASTDGIARQIVQIPIELTHDDAKIPAYADPGDAGMDVVACDDYTVNPGETIIIPLNIKTAIPLGHELQVRPRSGQSVKTKMRIANSPGTIDANYRDGIGVIIENIEPRIKDLELEEVFIDTEKGPKIDHYIVKSVEYGKPYEIVKGQRFAQLVLSEVSTAAFFQVDSVAEIGDNRMSGFGGTGDF